VPDPPGRVTFGSSSKGALRLDLPPAGSTGWATHRRIVNVNDQIVHTTDAAFDTDVVKSPQPVLLDFWAEWCTPCKMIAPILDVIADEYKDRLRVVKLNIDENPKTPPKYNIRGIPTLLLFRDGTVAAQQVGAVSKTQLESFLNAHLNRASTKTG
jgi:thioredoxin 1